MTDYVDYIDAYIFAHKLKLTKDEFSSMVLSNDCIEFSALSIARACMVLVIAKLIGDLL